jgi:EAL domain-containing protein (putative c-di-GMP-specific phosphodiesterase class I)
VRDIDSTPVNESIARAIVALADSLALEIVAEGIETASEVEVLKRIKCVQGQGFLFSKPLDAERFSTWLLNRARSEIVMA